MLLLGSGRRDAVWFALVLTSGAAGVILGRGGIPGFESARERQARIQAQQLETVLAKTSGIERSLAQLAGAPPRGCPAAGSQLDASALREEIAVAVREASKAEPSGGRKDADERAAAEPTPENLEAFDQAKGILDNATTAGRWGEQDARALRPLLGRLSADEQRDIMRQLGVAINTGKLVPQMHGSPI
jgi:hypothetical protein